jgi:hypothetical protein
MQWFKFILRVLSVTQLPHVSGVQEALSYQLQVQKWIKGGV